MGGKKNENGSGRGHGIRSDKVAAAGNGTDPHRIGSIHENFILDLGILPHINNNSPGIKKLLGRVAPSSGCIFIFLDHAVGAIRKKRRDKIIKPASIHGKESRNNAGGNRIEINGTAHIGGYV